MQEQRAPAEEEQADEEQEEEAADEQEQEQDDEGGHAEEPEEENEEADAYDGDIPDSPTGGYQIGGLGVGSHFFNADDLTYDPLLKTCLQEITCSSLNSI